MANNTCTLDDCDKPHQARGLCMNHYVAARRAGLENLEPNPAWHNGSNPDERSMLIDCSACGPSVPMRIYNGRHVCMVAYSKRRQYNKKSRPVVRPPSKHAGDPTYKRRRRYNLEPGGVERLLAEANGQCAICEDPITITNMHIDHDHACCPGGGDVRTCGQCVRGVLCSRCNMGLGQLRDDPALLRAGAEYLERTAVSIPSK